MKKRFIFQCRSCKMKTLDTLMIPYGLVKYCNDCAQLMRVCYYCDQKSNCHGMIQIKECNPNLHRFLIKVTLEEEFVDHINCQVMPKLIELVLQQQAQCPNFKCEKCYKELISHILV